MIDRGFSRTKNLSFSGLGLINGFKTHCMCLFEFLLDPLDLLELLHDPSSCCARLVEQGCMKLGFLLHRCDGLAAILLLKRA